MYKVFSAIRHNGQLFEAGSNLPEGVMTKEELEKLVNDGVLVSADAKEDGSGQLEVTVEQSEVAKDTRSYQELQAAAKDLNLSTKGKLAELRARVLEAEAKNKEESSSNSEAAEENTEKGDQTMADEENKVETPVDGDQNLGETPSTDVAEPAEGEAAPSEEVPAENTENNSSEENKE